MINLLYKFGFRKLVEKFLKEALFLAIQEVFKHKQEVKKLLVEKFDELADTTKNKLVEKVEKL